MKRNLALLGVAGALVTTAVAAPAMAMHTAPGPVDEAAPAFSGHYSTPDTGQKGDARPWEAGPAWDRQTP